jgi:hypothetical protein
MIFPDVVVIWLAVVGGCAFIFGANRVGTMLAMPAVVRFVLLPNFAPALDQVPVAPVVLLLPVILVFGGISLLQAMVRFGYGETAGGYVAGNYLLRVFDFIGRAIFAIVCFPFRMLGRHVGRRVQNREDR